jgi:hypothetical protein
MAYTLHPERLRALITEVESDINEMGMRNEPPATHTLNS